MSFSKVLTAFVLALLIATPTLSFAKARGGGGGYSGGSRSSGSSTGSIGSRGSRTYDNNGYRPIERSATSKPSTAPAATAPANPSSAPAAQPSPARQPSFLQQHPLLAGIAGGLAGTWIGHMLFGATDSSARTTETDARDKGQETDAGSGGSMGLILILMLLAGGIWYYVMRARRTPQPDFSGMGRSSFGGAALTAPPSSSAMTSGSTDLEIGAADKAAFQQLLTEIQDAWSKQDLTTLRRLTTPEMLSYFNAGLSENASQEVENRIEDLTLISAELREAWREDGSDYATVLFRWKAKDYTLSLTKKRDEPGAIVDGTDQALTETSEVWTFMRYQQGKWLLSAIQQIE